MASEKLEDLSTEKLIKRKRFFTLITGIYLGLGLIAIVIVIADIISDDQDFSLPSAVVFAFTLGWLPLVMYSKVDKELKRRNDQ